MKPFKRWTDDEYWKVLLTPGYDQFRDDFKLLKVLDLSCVEMIRFPLEILSLVWLRYLALCQHRWGNLDIPPGICRLWNLETFIVEGLGRSGIVIPEQIWGLMQLRHLKMELNKLVLPDCPKISVDRGENTGFANIQTISWLSSHCCTKEVILGIRNVKKLGICGIVDNDHYESFCNNLVHLNQLGSLSLKFFQRYYSGIHSAKLFPATLKKLKLEGTFLSWSYLDMIAELPNLEVLKLMKNACDGEEWDPIVRGFTRLKILLIDRNSDLQYWKATNDNFPVLERLFIRYCPFLKEIPVEFADIYSLQLIQLEYCSPKLEASAAQIQLEQEDLGNNPVVVRITKLPGWSDSNDDDDDNDGDDDDGVDLS